MLTPKEIEVIHKRGKDELSDRAFNLLCAQAMAVHEVQGTAPKRPRLTPDQEAFKAAAHKPRSTSIDLKF